MTEYSSTERVGQLKRSFCKNLCDHIGPWRKKQWQHYIIVIQAFSYVHPVHLRVVHTCSGIFSSTKHHLPSFQALFSSLDLAWHIVGSKEIFHQWPIHLIQWVFDTVPPHCPLWPFWHITHFPGNKQFSQYSKPNGISILHTSDLLGLQIA